jgi:hypothetical protein
MSTERVDMPNPLITSFIEIPGSRAKAEKAKKRGGLDKTTDDPDNDRMFGQGELLGKREDALTEQWIWIYVRTSLSSWIANTEQASDRPWKVRAYRSGSQTEPGRDETLQATHPFKRRSTRPDDILQPRSPRSICRYIANPDDRRFEHEPTRTHSKAS